MKDEGLEEATTTLDPLRTLAQSLTCGRRRTFNRWSRLRRGKMVAVSITYEGELNCRATHGPSGSTLVTGAPADNGGKGEHFSPTDLVATALGTCILTTVAMKAQSLGLDLHGATAAVEKEMSSGPRRIGRLATTITIPGAVPARERKLLEAAAHACPVHRSMSPDVEMPIAFNWV